LTLIDGTALRTSSANIWSLVVELSFDLAIRGDHGHRPELLKRLREIRRLPDDYNQGLVRPDVVTRDVLRLGCAGFSDRLAVPVPVVVGQTEGPELDYELGELAWGVDLEWEGIESLK